MSIAKDSAKIVQKPRILHIHCALQELIDIADELDEKLAQFEDGGKLGNLLHKLLNRIKIDVQEGDALIPNTDGSYRSFQPIKPASLSTLLTFRSVARLHEERKNWTREMYAKDLIRNMEQARTQAIADGRAIEHEWEAAIDD